MSCIKRKKEEEKDFLKNQCNGGKVETFTKRKSAGNVPVCQTSVNVLSVSLERSINTVMEHMLKTKSKLLQTNQTLAPAKV